MPTNDTYKSIAAISRGNWKDNGSKFLAFAFPVTEEDEVKEIVSSLKKEYHDARHHCFAYRIGFDGSLWRASDDGEPAGSAGRQILSRIDAAGLSDVLVVVVRYFGGIKLGIPGLIRAYRNSTDDALTAAEVTEKIAGRWTQLRFRYDALPAVMKVVKDLSLPQRGQSFLAECSLEVYVRLSLADDFCERIKKIDIFTED